MATKDITLLNLLTVDPAVLNEGTPVLTINTGTLTINMPIGIKDGIDTTDTTATLSTVLAGAVFHKANGQVCTGTIPTAAAPQFQVHASDSSNIIRISSHINYGYIDKSLSRSVLLNSTAISTNLRPANIAKGVKILGVQGTLDAAQFYKCKRVDIANNTWTGYKFILLNNKYVFSAQETTSLPIGGSITPVVGKVYNHNATALWGILTLHTVLLGQVVTRGLQKMFQRYYFIGTQPYIDLSLSATFYRYNTILAVPLQAVDVQLGQIINYNGLQRFVAYKFRGQLPDYGTTLYVTTLKSYKTIKPVPLGGITDISAGYITISESSVTVHNITKGTETSAVRLYITDTGKPLPEYT